MKETLLTYYDITAVHSLDREHTKITIEKSQKRNNIVRKIAGNDWECTKETLGVTYKAIGKRVIIYGAPIWAPTLSDTN